MVVVGLLAATDALVRGLDRDPLAFYMVSIIDMMIFPTLVFSAFRARFDPQTLKRIILVATIALIRQRLLDCRLPWYIGSRR
jgi:hypothetical protein